MGFHAYEVWRGDLLDDGWYENNDDEQFARRFSVNQFCTLALTDARKAAYAYLGGAAGVLPEKAENVNRIAGLFGAVAKNAEQAHKMLDSGEYLEGARARRFWTRDMRREQAELLSQMLDAERQAADIVISMGLQA
jgi:hypothetical protein